MRTADAVKVCRAKVREKLAAEAEVKDRTGTIDVEAGIRASTSSEERER